MAPGDAARTPGTTASLLTAASSRIGADGEVHARQVHIEGGSLSHAAHLMSMAALALEHGGRGVRCYRCLPHGAL